MTDRMDKENIQEIPGQQNFILDRFLREFDLNIKVKKDSIKQNIKENKILFSEIKNIGIDNLKELIPLNIINPLILERENADRRIDEFIREGINRRIPQRVEHPLPLANLPVPDLAPKRRFSSPTGLRADKVAGFAWTLTVNGEKVVFENYNDIHFMPEGRGHLDFSRITDSLTKGIQGVVELLDAIDQRRFDAASVFVGITNINMALIAQRLGFVIIDECRNQDGSINKNLAAFAVVGKLGDIRARVEEFKRAGVAQRLQQRNQRLQAKPKLAPAGT